MRKLASSIIVAVLIAVLLVSGLLVGCAGVVKGSGNLDTQEFNFRDFARVEVGYAFDVDIAQSSSYSVSITTDDNLFDYILVSKQGTTLKIVLKPALHYASTKLQARITLPQLRGLGLSGATRGTVSGFSSTDNIDIEVSGASSLNLVEMSAGDVEFDISGASRVTGEITAGDVEFDVSGASTIQLEGSANDIIVDASGASHVKLAAFPISNADITLSGASHGTVNLDGRLDADLSGASHLSYIGEPTMGDIDISGASGLSKK